MKQKQKLNGGLSKNAGSNICRRKQKSKNRLETSMHKRSRILLAIVVIVAGLLVSALVFSSSLFSAGPKSQETGTLAVLLTDPPSLPNGATALYMNYGSVQVHSTSDIAATSSSSDWIDLGASGVLNLTSLVNATQ